MKTENRRWKKNLLQNFKFFFLLTKKIEFISVKTKPLAIKSAKSVEMRAVCLTWEDISLKVKHIVINKQRIYVREKTQTNATTTKTVLRSENIIFRNFRFENKQTDRNLFVFFLVCWNFKFLTVLFAIHLIVVPKL